MEKLPVHAGGSKANAAAPLHLTLDNTTSTSSPSPPQSAGATAYPAAVPSSPSNHERGTDILKAKILSHPLYPALLRAFIECQKVGAPPEVVGRLSNLAGELDPHQGDRRPDLPDPELDEFMETYCHMLVRYRQELTRPIQEADQFFRAMEAQMDSFALDDNSCEGGDSSEDEHETGDVAGLPPTITGLSSGEDEGLKKHLLNKYSGYLSSLWGELSRKKKKKGKLPRDARQKLLHWWHLHYRWPYPSELEKAELSVTTGLDGKQINNWFINQRKRHWKPTVAAAGGAVEYMWHPAATYGAGAASSSSYAALRVEGHHFAGGSSYPRGS